MARTRLVPLVLLVGALTACGSTVNRSQLASSGEQATTGLTQGTTGGAEIAAGGTLSGPAATGPDTTAAAASGPQSSGGAGGGTGPGAASGSGSQQVAPGTTTAPGPLSVGFVVADFTKTAAAFGFGAVQSPQRYFEQLVSYYNSHGGLAGRKIAPVYSSVDGSSADWSTASQAVCSDMTEDNHVELVLSNLWVNPTLTACLLRASVPQIEGTTTVSNTTKMLASFPNLVVPAGIANDREIATRIAESVRLGWLTPKDKLGIVYDGCPYSTNAVKEAALPTARRYGIPVEAVQSGDCGTGFADVGKFSSAMQNAAFKTRSAGATKVMFETQGENGALVFFSNNAETQGWHPTYIVSSNAMISSVDSGGEMNSGQRPYVRGIGWYPTFDEAKPTLTPQMRDCQRHIIAGGGSVPTSLNDTLAMYASCNAVTAAEAALKLSGGRGRLGALQPAIERLGASYVSVTSLQGRTRFGPGRHDGAAAVAPFALKKDCDCFGYVGPPHAVP